MPQVTLTFNIPDEASELNLALRGGKYFSALHNFDRYLREQLKYKQLTEKERQVFDQVRDAFNTTLLESGVDLSDE